MAPKTLKTRDLNPKDLNPREMKAWRSYIIASRRLLDALDSDLSCHDLSMADYEVLALLNDAPERPDADDGVGGISNGLQIKTLTSDESFGEVGLGKTDGLLAR
jgi:hypothetical protein